MTKQPARIVLVEDNPGDVQLLRFWLDAQEDPYTLEVLADGEAALRFVREQCPQDQDNPCLIVLDLHLPKHGGAAVLQAIKEEPALAQVRVAVLTTVASPQDEAEVRALGVHLYRRKPVDLDKFEALAGELLALCQESDTQAAAT